MKLTYQNIDSIDCNITDIIAFHSLWKKKHKYDYENCGRTKYLLYYQLENERFYYRNGKQLCHLKKNDIIFLPHGIKYTSETPDDSSQTSGIGISFNICDQNGQIIETDEDFMVLCNDSNGHYYNLFKRILLSVLHPNMYSLKIKADLYNMLDMLFSKNRPQINFDSTHSSILSAVELIENSPEESYSVKELAEMCYMSESSFLRKFKNYSGGITPLKYRNHIRIMRAEELIDTSKTVDEIAELLGFYDASHLCRIYKQMTGHTLKKKS